MSLDGLRDVYTREKKSEIATCELSRKRKLRELYGVSTLITTGNPPQPHLLVRDELSDDERRFLEKNDMSQGLRFNDATLPYPIPQYAPLPSTLPFQAPVKRNFPALPISSPLSSPVVGTPSLEDQLRAASASPSVASQPGPRVRTPVTNEEARISDPTLSRPLVPDGTPSADLVEAPKVKSDVPLDGTLDPAEDVQAMVDAQLTEPSSTRGDEIAAEARPDVPSADPLRVIPPSAEDAVALGTALPSAPKLEPKEPQAAKVVHLPSQKEQEARLAETEQRLERARENNAHDYAKSLGIPATNGSLDALSSPTSTVGPYSQATPHAPHHSPDTSPDQENFEEDAVRSVSRIAESEADPAARRVKEENERALQSEVQEARERARGEKSVTPDIERQLEEEQALRLARDGEASLNGTGSASAPSALTDQAENVAKDVAAADADNQPSQSPARQEPAGENSGSEALPRAVRATSAAAEHPTPPAEADVDVSMAEAPPSSAEKGSRSPAEEKSMLRVTDHVPNEPKLESVEQSSIAKVMLTPRSSHMSAASASPDRRRSQESRGKCSAVTFVKHDPQTYAKELHHFNEDFASLQGAVDDPNRDYLLPLFQYQAHTGHRSAPIGKLVDEAKKTLSTRWTLSVLREQVEYRILKRVYQLQNANRWPNRQIQKSAEPSRPQTHLDSVLKEMKWMSTDFREERRWKKGLAATFARWCSEYKSSPPEAQAKLRVRARIPSRLEVAEDDMHDAPTPDLEHSGANETENESLMDEEEHYPSFLSNPPTGLFSLGFDDVVFKMDRTPASEAMLLELPAYEPNIDNVSDITPRAFYDPPILPVSKYITGKVIAKANGRPRKRSRYEYDSDPDALSPPSRPGTSMGQSLPSTPGRLGRPYRSNDLDPEMMSVALFDPEFKHTRERLHAAQQFKPPTEHPMPSVSFFENRLPSQWLWDEDQKLRTLVKEYSFNWSLVAQELSSQSRFVSGALRRTPWECFERWMHMDGLPGDMGKTPYFKTYQSRLEQAFRTVMAQQQQMLQQQANPNQAVPASQARRRTNQPYRIERRRESRHLSMIEAMRKLAKKREQQVHKAAEAQKAAALRKAHEAAPTNKSNVHTPQEFSRLKWEKEEKRKQLQLQHENQIRATLAQRQMQGMQGQPGMPNVALQQQRIATPGGVNVPAQMASAASQAGLAPLNPMTPRTHPAQQNLQANFPNASLSGMPMNTPGVPQAQMQANLQNSQRMAPPDQIRLAMQRGQYSATTPNPFQLQQQQMHMAQNLAANMGNSMLPNAGMMGSVAGQNMMGAMNSALNGPTSNAGSPRVNQANSQLQNQARPMAISHMPQLVQIQNKIRAQHPDWSQDQVQKAAGEHLQRLVATQQQRMQAQQQALASAAGQPAASMNARVPPSGIAGSPQLGNTGFIPNGGMQGSPSPNPVSVSNYQAQLLQQQRNMMSQQHQQAGSPGLSARPVSRSATPQNPQQLGIQSPGTAQQPRA